MLVTLLVGGEVAVDLGPAASRVLSIFGWARDADHRPLGSLKATHGYL